MSVWAVLCFLVSAATPLFADELRLAVAANFTEPFQRLAGEFEKQSGHKILPAFGSTGKFYLQIVNGAPFEIFLAADVKHPRLLESKGAAIPGTRFTYAKGKIILWSPQNGYIDSAGRVLTTSNFRFLAIANPDVAPYGRATKDYLSALNLWQPLTAAGRIVLGQDIAQAYHFVSSGHAELGIVALSQIEKPGARISGSYYVIPAKFYEPLEQQAILIKHSGAANEFMQFLKSPATQRTIRTYGYDTN